MNRKKNKNSNYNYKKKNQVIIRECRKEEVIVVEYRNRSRSKI